MNNAKIAASWWVNQIATTGDTAAIERLGQVGSPITRMRARLTPSAETLEEFRAAIETAIMVELQFRKRVELWTDYEAYGLLADIAKSTGVSLMCFPFKTRMFVSAEGVTVNGKQVVK